MKLVQTEKTSIWNAVGGPSCVAKDAGCIQSAIALADQRQGNGHRKRVGAKGGRDRAHGGSIDVNDVDVSISTVVGRQVYVEIHPQVRTIRTLSSDVRGDACALVLVRVKVNESKHGIELAAGWIADRPAEDKSERQAGTVNLSRSFRDIAPGRDAKRVAQCGLLARPQSPDCAPASKCSRESA